MHMHQLLMFHNSATPPQDTDCTPTLPSTIHHTQFQAHTAYIRLLSSWVGALAHHPPEACHPWRLACEAKHATQPGSHATLLLLLLSALLRTCCANACPRSPGQACVRMVDVAGQLGEYHLSWHPTMTL
jgi:hypothetical protein